MLPVLREELALYPGPRLADGQPSWTLHDPVRNAFFRIDWLTFEILNRWQLNDARAIADAVASETTLHPELEDIEGVARFLVENQLTQAVVPDSSFEFAARFRRMRHSWAEWLLHHYLFFRIPLVKPDRWLTRWVDKVGVFYTRKFFRLTLIVLAVSLVLVYRNWELFTAAMVDVFTWKGIISYGVALIGVKLLHELGHAFTAKRYGCRVPAMGVAFLVMWPMPYTDTNETWKLADKHQRLAVAAAGIITELIVAVWATLAWVALPEGMPKTVAFILATTTWILTLAINASPFMRFDGYFLLSDWLEMPNLHQRAFALARWDLRERLFGLQEAPPEHFPPKRALALILFAYATWVYRLTLFIGIAVLVYHFFIKLVGILLFAVEIGWFVLLPLWGEIKAWRERWPVLRIRARAKRTAMVVGIFFLLVAIPWPARVSSSGNLRALDFYPVYASEGAQVVTLKYREGQVVPTGEPMIELASPELEQRWRKVNANVESLRKQVSTAALGTEQRHNLLVLQQELETAEAELASVLTVAEKYSPRAPFDGKLRDLDPSLKPGVWVSRGERLAVLVRDGKWQVETYLDDNAMRRVQIGDSARFYTDGLEGPFLSMTVAAVNRDSTRVLTDAMLAAPFGGSVMVRERHGQLFPDRGLYRVTLTVTGDPARLAGQSWRGTVVIHAAWEAPALKYIRTALALIWREAGF
jgi:putative peptide zinc metalloprotease protein